MTVAATVTRRQCEGRVALVTGGSGNIGSAASRALAAQGAAVVVHYHGNAVAAHSLVDEIVADGGRAVALQADVTNPDDVERLMKDVASFGAGKLDVLFNNAGVSPYGSLAETSVDEWNHVLAVNVRGPFLCTKTALPLLAAADDARVINVGSVIPFLGISPFVHYAASKAAIWGFTHSLAHELAGYGITVNCIVPGNVARVPSADNAAAEDDQTVRQQAVKRIQVAADLVTTIVFLASTSSQFMTGQTIVVDGGRFFT